MGQIILTEVMWNKETRAVTQAWMDSNSVISEVVGLKTTGS